MRAEKKNTKSIIYKFLSECFYYPDVKQIENIISYKENIPEKFLILFELLRDTKEIQIDYSRLFVGPFNVISPPYGSIYLEEGTQVLGDSTLDVEALYMEENLCVSMKEPPDHIAIELEFMHFLITKECIAIENYDFTEASNYIQKQVSFMERHLSCWVEEFTDLIKENAQTAFYKSLAELMKHQIRADLHSPNISKIFSDYHTTNSS